MSCGIGHRHGSDLGLLWLWLWLWLAATAPIWPLAEPLYAAGVALGKKKKDQKKKKKLFLLKLRIRERYLSLKESVSLRMYFGKHCPMRLIPNSYGVESALFKIIFSTLKREIKNNREKTKQNQKKIPLIIATLK